MLRSKRSSLVALLVLAAACGADHASSASDDEPLFAPAPNAGGKADVINACDAEIDLEPAFGNIAFTQPTVVRQHPSLDVFYVVERRGVIWRVPADATSPTQVTLFADVRSRVNSGPQEAGLLGLAFDPAFAQNGRIYLSYTGRSAQSPVNLVSRISRFTVNNGGDTLDVDSEQFLLGQLQPFDNHNGGAIEFGPDGLLYIALGDGGSAGDPNNNAQNVNSLLGKLLRIDVSQAGAYRIPATNPFANGGGRAEIFAYGLRNPWRFTFDRVSGTILAGDVGQDAVEEIDIVSVGRNYGWRIREGNDCFNPAQNCTSTGLTAPLATYPHQEGTSITGGYLYRGDAVAGLQGQYVFADFVSGRVWALAGAPGGGVARRLIAQTDNNISTFAEDRDGNLMVADLFDGRVYRIVENAGCEDPTDDPTDAPTSEPSETFDEIYSNIIAPRCGPCHTSGSLGGLAMPNAAAAYDNMVNNDAASPACGGRMLVIPGDPANSVLYQKVSGQNLCGSAMPPGPSLSTTDVDAIEAWIAAGAER